MTFQRFTKQNTSRKLFYLNFFIQLDWVLDASVIEPKVEINASTGIIGLCYPTEEQFLMKKNLSALHPIYFVTHP